ncbi:MAG: type I-E CRISPR-associated protein Cas5/CasD [Candidatus Sulfotelmatobacter sp.]
MSDTANLALLLDGPLQSWGVASWFQRRTTGLYPTKSGVIGLLGAAMGLAKGSSEEAEWLPKVAALEMTSIVIPRNVPEADGPLPLRRLEDYHTVLETRRASGAMNKDAVVTRRQYLLEARFGVILAGDRSVLERVAAALQDPIWGVWLGRKSCIPSAPLFVALCKSPAAAWKALLRVCKLSENTLMETFTNVREVKHFTEGTDSINDQPVSFGDGTSSGSDMRQFHVRRIAVKPGIRQS